MVFGTLTIIYNTIYKMLNRGYAMATTIEYENMTTSIVNFNLSASGEPSPTNNLNSPSGLLAELYLGPRIETQSNLMNSKWHIHYRE
jgi:hypothetical protein